MAAAGALKMPGLSPIKVKKVGAATSGSVAVMPA